MNQAQLLRKSRSKHTLKSYEAAVKQFQAFRTVRQSFARRLETSTPPTCKTDRRVAKL